MADETTLISLAILKVNADAGKDYIENLVPFVKSCLLTHRQEFIANEYVQKSLKDDFGLNIPLQVIEIVLRRLAKRKLLNRRDGLYAISVDFSDENLGKKKERAIADLDFIISRIITFAKEKHNVEWNEEQASSAVIAWLSRFGIDFLRTYLQQTALPEKHGVGSDSEKFIISSFLHKMAEHNRELLDKFVIFVQGQMLANALTCPDLESINRKFNNVSFYFDTPLIMNLLGLQGNPSAKTARELVALLLALKGNLAVFSHTLEEINNVLQGCADKLHDPDSHGVIIDEIRRTGKTYSDLILIKEKLEDRLHEYSIKIQQTSKYEEIYQIDEKLLEDAIRDEISYLNPRAISYDINSIRCIYVIRKGTEPRRLEDAIGVLVTTNAALSRAAYEYGVSQESTRQISPVITEFSLANVAWLKSPIAAPELPKTHLIAACYAAMSPPTKMWSAFLHEIDKLRRESKISSDDHALLKVSLHAREELMDMTLGSTDEFSYSNILNLIERVKSRIKFEAEDRVKEIVSERNDLGKQLEIAELNAQAKELKLDQFAAKIGSFVGNSILIMLIIVMAVGLFLTSLNIGDKYNNNQLKYGILVATLLGTIFSLYNWITGKTLKNISVKIAETVATRIKSTLS